MRTRNTWRLDERSKVSCKVWRILLLGFAVLYRAAIENTHNFLYFDWILLRFSFVLQYQAVRVILSWLFWVSVSSRWHDRSVLGHTKFCLEFLSFDHFLMEFCFTSVKCLQDVLFLFLLNPQLLKVAVFRPICWRQGLGKIELKKWIPFNSWVGIWIELATPLGSWIGITESVI